MHFDDYYYYLYVVLVGYLLLWLHTFLPVVLCNFQFHSVHGISHSHTIFALLKLLWFQANETTTQQHREQIHHLDSFGWLWVYARMCLSLNRFYWIRSHWFGWWFIAVLITRLHFCLPKATMDGPSKNRDFELECVFCGCVLSVDSQYQ